MGRGRNRLTDSNLLLHVRRLNERIRHRQQAGDRRDAHFACTLSDSLELHVARRAEKRGSARMVIVQRSVRAVQQRILFAVGGFLGV